MIRDPLTDPQPGDVVVASMPRQTVERRVVRRDGGNVYYSASTQRGTQLCWHLTWRRWCQKHRARVEIIAPSKS